MANHATVNTQQTSRTTTTTANNNRVIINPEELGRHMELFTPPPPPERPPRTPPAVPARPVAPGAAVRIHSTGQQRRTATMPHTTTTTPPLAVPRVPAPTLPALRPLTTTTRTSSSSIPADAAEVITLSQPRPDVERVRNEYIDTPLKGGLRSSTPLHAETHIHISGSPHDHLALVSPLGTQSAKASSTKSLPFTATTTTLNNSVNTPLTSPSLKRLHSTRRSLPITKQPSATTTTTTFTKDSSNCCCCSSSSSSSSTSSSSSCRRDVNCPSTTSSTTRMVVSPGSAAGVDSVICPQCDRCRCLSCRTPRPLPSKWLCGDKCLCSAESCVDYASCLCCVKGLFYHCGTSPDNEDDEDVHRRGRRSYHQQPGGAGSCADAPCSCVPSHHRAARWGCLASLTLVLPCLLCYWPLQGGVKVVEMCYQRCTSHGCRCDTTHPSRRQPPTASSDHIAQQQPMVVGSSKTAVVVQPLPSSSGKRLLDI